MTAAEVAGTTKSEGKQACPFLKGEPFDMAEAAKKHSDRLE
jgi:hypothetical protein